MDRTNKILKSLSNGIIIAGILLLLIGAYYAVIKAGIPYQDPPLELQIQYAANSQIGNTLIKDGLITVIVGIVGKVIIRLISRKQK